MAEINSIQLPSGASYDLTDGIHMPSEATTVAEMVANATGAGDTGIAVFGLSASLTNTICGTSATSICVTKYSSTDSRVDFTIQIPSVENAYYGADTAGTLSIQPLMVMGFINTSDSNSVTITYNSMIPNSSMVAAFVRNLDEFIELVSGSTHNIAGNDTYGLPVMCIGNRALNTALTGLSTWSGGSAAIIIATRISADVIEYAALLPYALVSTANRPNIFMGELTISTKAVLVTYKNWDQMPLYFQNQTVNVGTGTTIMTISDSRITSKHIVMSITFANPEYITSDVTWTSASRSMTFTGTCTTATTANVIIQAANPSA